MGGQIKDLSGKQFEHCRVVDFAFVKKRAYWNCVCECGNKFIASGSELSRGSVTACGCRQKLGWGTNKTHGLTNTRLHRIWNAMKQRTINPKNKYYCNYGGRGIKVCEEWFNDFISFYNWAIDNGYSDNLSIDRIDVNGNYEPSNCRWATKTEQMNNCRNTRFYEYDNKSLTLSEWSKITCIPYSILSHRINIYGWSVSKALETPYVPRKKVANAT